MPLTTPNAVTLSYYDNLIPGSTATSEPVDASMYVFPMDPVNEIPPGYITASTIFLNYTGTVSTAAAFSRSMSIGFFTSVAGNSTQLTRVFSASSSWGTNAANMNINDSVGGWKWLTVHSSQFDVNPAFGQSRYWVALWHRSSSGSQSFSLFGMQSMGRTDVRSGIMSLASSTNTTFGWGRFRGAYSVTFSSAMPNAIAASDVNKNIVGANFIPQILINNVGTNIV